MPISSVTAQAPAPEPASLTRPIALGLLALLLLAVGVAVLVFMIGRPTASRPAPGTTVPTATGLDPATQSQPPPSSPSATGSPDLLAVLVGAGDIADCGSTGDEATAVLLDQIGGTVFTLGDNVYPSGTPDQFLDCYGPSWGRHLTRTFPSAGNHDYETPGAAGYYGYFDAAAGRPGEGWYSYEAGAWHVVVLNSMCAAVGGCHAGSPQEAWLRADLAANPTACTLAYWHHPRFSSGSTHGSDATYDAFWRALHDAGADVVLAGHDHVYERFVPQDPDGVADTARGIRQFTVGTGGRSLYAFGAPLATTQVRDSTTFGVLRLTFRPETYEWRFVPVAGGAFSDAGTANCH